ncbi:aminopeptidase [Chloroflexota bacterium]
MRRALLFLLIVFLIVISSCKPSNSHSELSDEQQYKLELITEIKAFEKKLGFDETENFKTYSGETEAYDYSFFTSKTNLPYSLDDPLLQAATGKPESVPIDLEKYDVFFYSIQAVAGIETPVTKSLLQAPRPRFIHVIFHEDWHEQMDSPLGIEEPCAEVVGYTAAMLFAREKFGQSSEVYETLQKRFGKKLEESELYQQYYDELDILYSSFHSGTISEADTLAQKASLLKEMANELRSLWGASPGQLNNAFVAFQMTYFRHFPLIQQVYSATNYDLAETMAIFRAVPAQGIAFDTVAKVKDIEKEATDYLLPYSQPED